MNTEKYSISLHIQSKCEKIWTRKTLNTVTFHEVNVILQINWRDFAQWEHAYWFKFTIENSKANLLNNYLFKLNKRNTRKRSEIPSKSLPKRQQQNNYVNIESNNPPNIIKQLPKSIELRLSQLSANDEILKNSIKPYKEALKKAGK